MTPLQFAAQCVRGKMRGVEVRALVQDSDANPPRMDVFVWVRREASWQTLGEFRDAMGDKYTINSALHPTIAEWDAALDEARHATATHIALPDGSVPAAVTDEVFHG